MKANGTLFWFVFQLLNDWRNQQGVKKNLNFFYQMLMSFTDEAGRKGKHNYKWSDIHTTKLTTSSTHKVNPLFTKKQFSKFLVQKFLIEYPSTIHQSALAVLQEENMKLVGEKLMLQQQHKTSL